MGRFGSERVVVETRMDAALETAIGMAEETSDDDEPVAGGGVLVIGSVVAAGEARTLLGAGPVVSERRRRPARRTHAAPSGDRPARAWSSRRSRSRWCCP